LTWLGTLVAAVVNAVANKVIAWYSTLRAGRAEAVADAVRIRDAEEAKAKAAGEEARKDHAMKNDDSAFDNDFKRPEA